jgi:hypothetical protein
MFDDPDENFELDETHTGEPTSWSELDPYELEELWEVSRSRRSRPCLACGMPVEDAEARICEECYEQWDDDGR